VNQTQKNLALLGGMVAAAVSLGLYAYFGVMKPDEQATEKKLADEKLVSFPKPSGDAPGNAAAFETLVITAKGETTTVEKTNGSWQITSPIQAPADTATLEGLVSEIQSASVKSVVEENPTPEDLKKYGLSPPKFLVKAYVKVPGESRQRELLFEGGIENTFDGSVYLRRQNDPRVYSAPGGLRWTLQKTLFDLRDKKLFNHPDTKVKSVEVQAKGNRYTVERVDEKTWKLTHPIQEDADTGTLQVLLSELRSLSASSFPEDNAARRKETGLDTPDIVLVVNLTDGSSVKFSQATVGSISHLLKEEQGKTVLAGVGGTAVGNWNKPLAELKDKALLKLKREDVAKVVFKPEGSGAEWAVQRAAADAGTDEWEVTGPNRAPAQRFKVAGALYVLENLKAAALAPTAPKDASRLGLGPTARAVSVFNGQGKLLGRVVFGAPVPDKANQIYARGAKNQIVEIDSTSLSQLPTQESDLTGAAAAPPPG